MEGLVHKPKRFLPRDLSNPKGGFFSSFSFSLCFQFNLYNLIFKVFFAYNLGSQGN